MYLYKTVSMHINKILQLPIIKKYSALSKKLIQKIQFQKKLQELDFQWEYFGSRCWMPFPPSFYYTHTTEEIKRIQAELREEIKQKKCKAY